MGRPAYGDDGPFLPVIIPRRAMSEHSQTSLRRLVDAIVANDETQFAVMLAGAPELAVAKFTQGATRQAANPAAHFLKDIGHQIYAGDTALHFAAGAYRTKMAEQLIRAGASVRARNRRGGEPLHAACFGNPNSPTWNPAAQVATIELLIEAGADPNAGNLEGATPLHRAVRTRCADAVRALLAHGADPTLHNKSGSTALELAQHTTGRPGSGSPEAKSQQKEILLLLGSR